MSNVFSLAKLKVGQIAEIVELKENGKTIVMSEKLGIAKGMSIIVLQQAVDWLVQVGTNQIILSKDMLNNIKVKLANI
ncbi:MAG: ferrous iron transport protein A [Clostridia bacterium]|nr:ferrous iron transport protein A [Clostridia bacterium]